MNRRAYGLALSGAILLLQVGCGGDQFSSATEQSGGSGAAAGNPSGGKGGGSSGSGGSGSIDCNRPFACEGPDLFSCADGIATLLESCGSSALCDDDAGECIPPSCMAGERSCQGATLQVCSPDGTGFEPEATCATAALCNATLAECVPPACDAGQYRCTGATLEACSADRTGFEAVIDCGSTELCDANSGSCELTCTPNSFQCSNATLLGCNAAGTAVGIEAVCFTAALCNAALGRCNEPACAPNEYDCVEASLRACNDDRTEFVEVDVCDSAALCQETPGACTPRACNSDDRECQSNVLRRCKDDLSGFEVESACTLTQECRLDPPSCFNLSEYAANLHGFTMPVPCGANYAGSSARICHSTSAPCSAAVDPVLSGAQLFDQTLGFGGDPGTIYDVTVRVQGQVEAKPYSGGADQSAGTTLPADGFYAGGAPVTDDATSAPYNIYVMRVSSPQKDYFFNSIATSAGDSRIRQSTFDIDFQATISIEGGATMRLIATDPNCLMTKNCADPEAAMTCSPHSVANLSSEIADDISAQPFAGQFLGFLVQSARKQP